MTDPAPIVLNDRYELRGLLGRGGMAEVYRGFDHVLGREVAVKVMHAALVADVDRQRFASETRLLAGLNNPHLVTLLDAGVDDRDGTSRPWLVMELVTGGTLASRLAGGPLPAEEVAAIGSGLATALSHVHANGIVHRDVKPSNVLVTGTGLTKLADFGVARLVDEQSDLTGTGFTIGTVAYLAPEQVRGLPQTGASDVYALGLVLLEALTGQRAYTGTSVEAALARLHRSPLIPVSLGAAWVQLLDAMTAGEATDRPGADQVAAQLAAIRGGATPAAAAGLDPTSTTALPLAASMSVAGADSSTGTGKKRRARRRTLAGAAAVALVLLAAGITWGIAGGTDSTPSAADAVENSRAPGPRADGIRPTTAPPSSPTSSATDVAPVKVDRPARSKHKAHGAKKSKPHKAKTTKHGKSGKGHGKGRKGKKKK
ncbi:serine/threonine protein kinase [Nocardioides immobilis]|uniref:non-specific serine/threonine protein kinase n=1 Tax=Nocardioides immobilis TaxID=2049295 RepID=A0A417XX97_9ACTN|nr:serine/threonine-protein kinase [Nocardioides immobilis]RHW25154.1 serine/threonine protein kinase [Nocardioides immobilis]